MFVCWFFQLACRLPARVQGYPWRLAYSTVKHGTSLKTLYRNLADVDSPVLLVIKDMGNQVDAVSKPNVIDTDHQELHSLMKHVYPKSKAGSLFYQICLRPVKEALSM